MRARHNYLCDLLRNNIHNKDAATRTNAVFLKHDFIHAIAIEIGIQVVFPKRLERLPLLARLIRIFGRVILDRPQDEQHRTMPAEALSR